MSNVLSVTAALNNARLLATRDRIDASTLNGYIEFYSAARPGTTGSGTYTAAAKITLAKPCGTINLGVLELEALTPGGEMITNTVTVLWARVFDGDGTPLADGDVTDDSGDGAFQLAGTSGTALFAGGYLLLSTTAIG